MDSTSPHGIHVDSKRTLWGRVKSSRNAAYPILKGYKKHGLIYLKRIQKCGLPFTSDNSQKKAAYSILKGYKKAAALILKG
jgi:hypothetical protein